MENYNVIIVGGGVMGLSAACRLSSKKKIMLIDKSTFENSQNASADYSRAFRLYGEDEYYNNFALESLKMWKKLEKVTKKKLFFPTGALLLGDSSQDYSMKSYRVLKRSGQRVSLLGNKELEKKFPQFKAKFGVLDHGAGILDAFLIVKTFRDLAKRNGVLLREKTEIVSIGMNILKLQNGEQVGFDKLIVTAGVLTAKLLKDFPIKITKQPIIYYQPKVKKGFSKEVFPAFAYLDKGFYGFPMHGIDAVKIASHIPGEIDRGDLVDKNIDKKFVSESREFLKKYIPELAEAKIIKSKMCYYDMTPDGGFIIDFFNKDIIVGTGFSGHGFKFAPLVGKILADLAEKGNTTYDISRFQLSRFS